MKTLANLLTSETVAVTPLRAFKAIEQSLSTRSSGGFFPSQGEVLLSPK